MERRMFVRICKVCKWGQSSLWLRHVSIISGVVSLETTGSVCRKSPPNFGLRLFLRTVVFEEVIPSGLDRVEGDQRPQYLYDDSDAAAQSHPRQ